MKKNLRIDKIILGQRPLIAVPFSGKTAVAAVRRAKQQGMDLAELRLDLFSTREQKNVLSEIRKFKNIPKIATIRTKKEGGAWAGPESARLSLFKKVIPSVDAVDIELGSKTILKPVIREAHALKKPVIVSYHNFKNTPSPAFLAKIAAQAKRAGADIVKIAVMARSKKDVRTLAEFTFQNASKNLITLSMGTEGALSRILLPSLGSLLTFAHAGRSTAPGQWDLAATRYFFKKLYR